MDPDADLVARWRAEETGQPEGWDFSSLRGRVREDDEPWNLDAEYRACLTSARHVLDMGTGGGEHLLTFSELLPADTVATEGWPPNVDVARKALEPRVRVVAWGIDESDSQFEPMPFEDNRFDLILNRHEAFDPREVCRVLAPGGTFLTQQVSGDEVAELHAATGKMPDHPDVTYQHVHSGLLEAGMQLVDGAEHVGHYEYADIAALVAYLQLVPWDVPDDFTVDRYTDALMQLHAQGPANGRPLRLTRKRFWLKAVKPLES